MIKYVSGNIFNSEADVIVNPVNTYGVMGKGLAKQFKDRYPKMFKIYYTACKEKDFSIGQLMLISEKDHRILLFPTKKHWKDKSKLEYIKEGLDKFVDNYERLNIKSIAFPKIGCGLGGLDWADVNFALNYYLGNRDLDVYIYADPMEG